MMFPPRLMLPRTTICDWSGFPRTAEQRATKVERVIAVCWAGVVQFDDMQVVVVVASLDRGADVCGIRLEVVEADFDRLLRLRSSSRSPTVLSVPLPAVTWVSIR